MPGPLKQAPNWPLFFFWSLCLPELSFKNMSFFMSLLSIHQVQPLWLCTLTPCSLLPSKLALDSPLRLVGTHLLDLNIWLHRAQPHTDLLSSTPPPPLKYPLNLSPFWKVNSCFKAKFKSPLFCKAFLDPSEAKRHFCISVLPSPSLHIHHGASVSPTRLRVPLGQQPCFALSSHYPA